MSDYRHHRVALPSVMFVEVPAAASPVPVHPQPPPRYPQQQREAWRPQRAIPTKRGKAEATKRLLDGFEIVRAMMTPNAALWQAWVTRKAA